MSKNIKAVVFWMVIVFSGVALWQVVKAGGNQSKTPEISYSQFLSEVEAGDVVKVTISGNEVYGTRKDRSTFRVIAPNSQGAMIEALRQGQVEIWFRDVARGDWPTWLMNLAPLILLGALWFIMIRQMKVMARARGQTNTPADPGASQWGGR